MSKLPIRRIDFATAQFAGWLAANGAEIGVPTNPYEVIRYRAYWCGSKRAVTHVVYAKEDGRLTFTGASKGHYEDFLAGRDLADQRPRAMEPVNPRPGKDPNAPTKGEVRREKLLARDGDECWFCGDPLGEDCTIEHLVPKSKRGGNVLDNFVLAHAKCNHTAADLPLVKKIEMRAKMRAEKEASNASV